MRLPVAADPTERLRRIFHRATHTRMPWRLAPTVARAGGTVERQPRPVEIRALTAEPASLPSDFRLHVTCSGGTYIRTLCADIGDALACGGTMAALRRTTASGYPVSACRTPARSGRIRLTQVPVHRPERVRAVSDATEPASTVSDRSAPAAVRCGRYFLRARRGTRLPGRHGNQNDQAVCPLMLRRPAGKHSAVYKKIPRTHYAYPVCPGGFLC